MGAPAALFELPAERRRHALATADLTPDEARRVLADVHAAYSGHDVPWLPREALPALFDVGDLYERLADIATLSPHSRRSMDASRDAARRKMATLHREASWYLETSRRRSSEARLRHAIAFANVRPDEAASATVRTTLAADDDTLARKPPVWWSDLRLERSSRPVQRAVLHRLTLLTERRGRAVLPPATHAALAELHERFALEEAEEHGGSSDDSGQSDGWETCVQSDCGAPEVPRPWWRRWTRRLSSIIFRTPSYAW